MAAFPPVSACARRLSYDARRDFLFDATAAAAFWRFADGVNPTAGVTALSVVEIDPEGVEPGMRITGKWNGKPVFLDHGTDATADRLDPTVRCGRIDRRARPPKSASDW